MLSERSRLVDDEFDGQFDAMVDEFPPEAFELIRRFNTFMAECAMAANRQLGSYPNPTSLGESIKYLRGLQNALQASTACVGILVHALLQNRHDPVVSERQIGRIITVTGMMIDGWYDQLPGLTDAMSF